MPPRRTKAAQIEERAAAQRKRDLAQAEARGKASGLRDALLLLGVGFGIGVVKALAPDRPLPRKCPLRSPRWGACGLDADHPGDCQPEELLAS